MGIYDGLYKMTIESIRIKNFRSLRDFNLDSKSLSVLVGANDDGKSNVLRALDLFFNSQKRDGYPISWDQDYCLFAKERKNKAHEIEVQIFYRLPESFNINERIVWKKIWRRGSPPYLHADTMMLESGDPLPNKSKSSVFMRSIRYDYVPAIKGREFFNKLLESVHDMLDATVQANIRSAADGLTGEIKNHTSQILIDLERKLGLKSQIQLPADLRMLFSDLEFHSEAYGKTVSLSQRGDGLKVRHVPIILNWLAEQANHLAAKGRPRVVTIWGYEEPENNLEIKKCFDLAKDLIDISENIQIFLTTHSPVFYTVLSDRCQENISVSEISKNEDDGSYASLRNPNRQDDMLSLDTSVGFLDLLKPHVIEWKAKVDVLEARLLSAFDFSKSTIFVEGPSDAEIINAAIKFFKPELVGKINVLFSTSNGGGHSWVKDSLIVWEYARHNGKMAAVGLFDNDNSAVQSLREFKEFVEDKRPSNRKSHKVLLPRLGPALQLAKLPVKIIIPVTIEEICPVDVWLKAKSENALEERDNLIKIYKYNDPKISFYDYISESIQDENLRLIVTNKISVENKIKFSKYVSKMIADPDSTLDKSSFKELIDQLIRPLGIE